MHQKHYTPYSFRQINSKSSTLDQYKNCELLLSLSLFIALPHQNIQACGSHLMCTSCTGYVFSCKKRVSNTLRSHSTVTNNLSPTTTSEPFSDNFKGIHFDIQSFDYNNNFTLTALITVGPLNMLRRSEQRLVQTRTTGPSRERCLLPSLYTFTNSQSFVYY